MRLKKSKKLALAYTMLSHQNRERDKRAAELVIANKELAFQNIEKEKREAELVIANNEKDKRAAELVIANIEKDKRAAELAVANIELAFQNAEKKQRAAELIIATEKLSHTEESLKQYIEGVKEIMFMTSHNVRHPVANIIGLSDQLNQSVNSSNSSEQEKKLVKYLKQSALNLDSFTKKLTTFISELEHKHNTE